MRGLERIPGARELQEGRVHTSQERWGAGRRAVLASWERRKPSLCSKIPEWLGLGGISRTIPSHPLRALLWIPPAAPGPSGAGMAELGQLCTGALLSGAESFSCSQSPRASLRAGRGEGDTGPGAARVTKCTGDSADAAEGHACPWGACEEEEEAQEGPGSGGDAAGDARQRESARVKALPGTGDAGRGIPCVLAMSVLPECPAGPPRRPSAPSGWVLTLLER